MIEGKEDNAIYSFVVTELTKRWRVEVFRRTGRQKNSQKISIFS